MSDEEEDDWKDHSDDEDDDDQEERKNKSRLTFQQFDELNRVLKAAKGRIRLACSMCSNRIDFLINA
jgi:TATA-binding protein-associated factor Taf7